MPSEFVCDAYAKIRTPVMHSSFLYYLPNEIWIGDGPHGFWGAPQIFFKHRWVLTEGLQFFCLRLSVIFTSCHWEIPPYRSLAIRRYFCIRGLGCVREKNLLTCFQERKVPSFRTSPWLAFANWRPECFPLPPKIFFRRVYASSMFHMKHSRRPENEEFNVPRETFLRMGLCASRCSTWNVSIS